MRVVIGRRLRGKRERKLGKVFFVVMVVIMLAVLIAAALGGLEALPAAASDTRTLDSLEIGDKVVDTSCEFKYRSILHSSINDETIKPVLPINSSLSLQPQSMPGQEWVTRDSGTTNSLRSTAWGGD